MTAIHTGLRRSELFRLEWEDINWERKCIIVKNKEDSHTKNYLNREIPMTPELCETLTKLKKSSNTKSGYIFPGTRNGESLLRKSRGHCSENHG